MCSDPPQAYSIPSSPPPNSSQRSLSASDSQDESEEKLSKTNLYIRGLSPGTTDEDLSNLCSRLATWTRLDSREVKLDVYGKWQNKTFAICLQLSVQ